MTDLKKDQSNIPGSKRDLGGSSTLGGAGAGTSNRMLYVQGEFVYDAQSNTPIGKIVDKPFDAGTRNLGGTNSTPSNR